MFLLQNRLQSHLLLFMTVVLLLVGESCVNGKGGRGGRGGVARGGAAGRNTNVARSVYSSGHSNAHNHPAYTNGHVANSGQASTQTHAAASDQQGLLTSQTDITGKDGHTSTSKKSKSSDQKRLSSQADHTAKDKPDKKPQGSETDFTNPDQHQTSRRKIHKERKDKDGSNGSRSRRNRKGHKHTTTTPFPLFI